MPVSPHPSKKDYAKMGRMLEDLYEAVTPNRRRLYKTVFIKGIIAGLGGVLGATILIAIVLWLLSLFETLPLIGPVIDAIQRSLERP